MLSTEWQSPLEKSVLGILEPVRRLEVFGSAARGDGFVPESSDADFLVEFAADAQPDLHRFYGAKAELEQLFGRGVDLVETGAVRNP